MIRCGDRSIQYQYNSYISRTEVGVVMGDNKESKLKLHRLVMRKVSE